MRQLIHYCLLTWALVTAWPGLGVAAPLMLGPQVATAQRLVQEGSRALAANNLPLALQKLELAYAKAQLPEVLYLLGKTAQLEHRELAAVDLYRRYLSATEGTTDLQRKAEIEQFIASVHEPPTELEVVSPDVGAVLRVDGRIVGVLPLGTPLLVSAGSHRFLVERSRQSFETNALQIAAGQRVQLQLALDSRYAVLSVATGVILLLQPQNASQVVQQQLRSALQASIQQVHGFLIQSEQTELALTKVNPAGALPCPQSLECQEKLARSVDAAHVITLTLKPSLASPKQVGLQIFDAATGVIAESAQDDCESCTPDTLRERIERLAQRVLQSAWNRGRGSLQITTDPAGASVTIGGRTLGETPFSRETFEGNLDLEITLDGFVPYKRKHEITRGNQTVLRVALQRPVVPQPVVEAKPPVPEVPVRRSRPVWRVVSGLALVGAGVILSGFGISALSANGSCVNEPATPGDVCPTVRSTKVPAGALMGIGGASLIAGVIVAAWPP